MYPRLDELARATFGVEPPMPLYSFGILVALAVVMASWLSKIEFERLSAIGQLRANVGKPQRANEGRIKLDMSPTSLALILTILATAAGVAGGMLPWMAGENRLGFPLGPLGTFYGGLIGGAISIAIFVYFMRLSVARVADALAPGLMLAYGIGRVGCYLAGDGDWGICSSLADKPRWIPSFLWSETFPDNILGVDALAETALAMKRNGLSADLCGSADGVFPTMLYETLMAAAAFAILWKVRKHPFRAGWLFSLYLVFNGVERFLIETIRLNPKAWTGLTVAQIIGIFLVILGLSGIFVSTRRGRWRCSEAGQSAVQSSLE